MSDRLKFTSHEDYIDAARADTRPILRKIGTLVAAGVPDAVRCIRYGMPAFKLGKTFFYFAAFKHHIGVYPPLTGDARLVAETAPYRNEKGNLAFPLTEAIPYELIGRVARALAAQYADTADRP